MSIFSKKQGVSLEDFCRDFYEKNILNPVIEGIDAGAVFFDTARKSITEANQNFANINPQKFATEMIPLRFELFALAWQHQFGDKLAVNQTVFTRHYLQEKKRNDIWEASESYNKAIARSCTLGKTSNSPSDIAQINYVNLMRADLFDQYYNEGFDPECVARAINRLFSDKAWKKRITAGLIMFALCDNLGFEPNFEPNNEAQFRLTAIIRGLYDGARLSFEKIKVRD